MIASVQSDLANAQSILCQTQDSVVISEKKNSEIVEQRKKLEASCEHLMTEIDDLTKSMGTLTLQCKTLEDQVSDYEKCKYKLRAENFTNHDSQIQFYTGFTSWSTFITIFNSLEVYELSNLQYVGRDRKYPTGKKRGPPRALNPLNEYFLTLVRLRLGLQERDLADRFGVTQSTVSVIVNTWLNLLHHHLVELNFWPSRDIVAKYMPREFATSRYAKTRIIIDATELFIEKPSDLSNQSVTWSNYKSHNTLKGLIGISPFGGVTFVSELWAGSISDIELTNKSGLLDLLQPGDNVMADKGFNIEETLYERGITLNIPPFMRNGVLTDDDVSLTRSIATLRIHVERAIERVKNFKILNGTIPNSIQASTVSKMFYVCSMLTNMQLPLVKPAQAQVNSVPDNSATVHSQDPPQVLSSQELMVKLKVSQATQSEVQLKTKDQADCEMWYKLRSLRLTSSNFGRICKRRSNHDTLARELLSSKKKLYNSKFMPLPLKWGKDHEPLAYVKYAQQLAVSSPMLKVATSGLWIDLNMGWLACSPDGLVRGQDKTLIGLLEIKSPYTARDMTVREACEKIPSFYCKVTDSGIELQHNHNYYFQVQGQLAITGASWCDFCVYTSLGIEVERIFPDQSFWCNTLQKLETFYNLHCVPILCKMSIVSAEETLTKLSRES
ncbi:hypothetical protein SPONL_2142 [uncultured Candidatus Thioglobus sp.]|nr:hypothetical protein SPONL_2142 [uncultured Candidatus Thioglobus sp.]